MEFSVRIEGIDRLAAKSQAVARIAREEVLKALQASGAQVEKEAKQSLLNGQKSGRVYRRGSVTHRASAPGEAPASDTGRLVNSIMTETDRSALETRVKARTFYAALLEFGTTRIAPRPFLFPALERSKAFIRDRMAKALDRTIDRAAKAGLRSLERE